MSNSIELKANRAAEILQELQGLEPELRAAKAASNAASKEWEKASRACEQLVRKKSSLQREWMKLGCVEIPED